MFITPVLFFLVYHQVFCWNTYRDPNSVRNFNFNRELNPNYDNTDSDNWVYRNNEKTHFNERINNEHSSRITFPDENNDHRKNNEHYIPDKEKNTNSHFILKCIRSCPLRNGYEPVCGTDDITYYNLDFLQCVRECGDDVELHHLSSCDDFDDIGSSTQPTTTRSNIESCVSKCPTTSEYNPVCGTDNVTYKNMGKLSCAQFCGVDVGVYRRLPCPKKTPDDDLLTTGTIETTTVNSRDFQTCMDSCLTTTEYKPVCASNGKTYYNNGKFQCAKSCGLNISIKFLGVCQINQFGESDTLSTTTTTIKPYEVSSKEPNSDIQNLLDKIFSNEDTGDPQLDVRHS